MDEKHHEQQLLASVMYHAPYLDEVCQIVSTADFADDSHRTIWQAALAIHESGKQVDLTSVAYYLRDSGGYVRAGGAKYLAAISESIHTAHHAIYLAEQVRAASVLRSLGTAAGAILEECKRPDADTETILARAERDIMAIQDRLAPQSETITAQAAVASAIREIEARRHNQEPLGLPTGYGELDAMLGGLRPGQLIVIAARPGIGKSALALNIAEHIGGKVGQRVVLFSLEMSAQELSERMLCSTARVASFRLRQGILTNEQMSQLREAASILSESLLLIDDTASTSVRTIAAKSRRLKRSGGLSAVIVDYLQLVEPSDRRAPREQQVAAITRSLKILAKELVVPIVVLSQLNRQADQGGKPRLSHLRESGAIEQDADVVLFVHRDPDDEEKKLEAELIVAKQRGGALGTVELIWKGEIFLFESRAPKRVIAFDAYNADAEREEVF